MQNFARRKDYSLACQMQDYSGCELQWTIHLFYNAVKVRTGHSRVMFLLLQHSEGADLLLLIHRSPCIYELIKNCSFPSAINVKANKHTIICHLDN